jgi:DNA-binding NtrC family response regulator
VRRPTDADESTQQILAALMPTRDVLAGRQGSLRRRVTVNRQRQLWDIEFWPLAGPEGLIGVLGKIRVSASQEPVAEPGFPEMILNLRQRFVQQFDLTRLNSAYPEMARVQEQARLAAGTDVPVLIVGPPGSGKHWLARAIHQFGPRREASFLRLDCRKLPAEIVLRELTRSPAGTIYLREPTALSRDVQQHLCQLLAEQPKARVISGVCEEGGETHRTNLLPELRCQLATLTISVPALRERPADIDGFVHALLSRAGAAAERTVSSCDPEALQILRSHSWPGNLRELYDVLLSACTHATADRIQAGDLPLYLRQEPVPGERTLPLDALLEQVEKRLIIVAMRLARNNKTRAAELLGIWRARLIRRMQGLGLAADDTDAGDNAQVEGDRTDH